MEPMPLRSGERVDDLLTHQLKIIQSNEVFSFSMDAVLLARFCTVPKEGNVLDLCTGNAVIPLLLSTRTEANIVGVEIQERLYDMAVRNVKLNQLEHQIQIVHADLRQYHAMSDCGRYDLVTVNPPYLPINSGEQNINEHIAMARHEIGCTFEEVVIAVSKLVRSGGKAAIVHRPARLVEIISVLRRHRMEPKRIRFVHPRLNDEANMVLIECAKDGKPEVRLLPPLIVYGEDGKYVPELLDIYYGRASQFHGNDLNRKHGYKE